MSCSVSASVYSVRPRPLISHPPSCLCTRKFLLKYNMNTSTKYLFQSGFLLQMARILIRIGKLNTLNLIIITCLHFSLNIKTILLHKITTALKQHYENSFTNKIDFQINVLDIFKCIQVLIFKRHR